MVCLVKLILLKNMYLNKYKDLYFILCIIYGLFRQKYTHRIFNM